MKLIELSREERLVVKAGRMFDGTGSPAVSDVQVEVVEGKVRLIESRRPGSGQAAGPDDRKGKSCRQIGGDEYTLLPGLIDCHVHLALDGCDFLATRGLWERPSALWPRVQSDLWNTLSCGVVAVRDGGDRAGIGWECRRRIVRGELQGPMLIASGRALRKEGKYGSFLGPGVKPDELTATVLKLAEEGVDQLKVLVSGVVSFKEYGRVGEVQFTPGELRQIVRVARSCGLRVMAHASSDEAVRSCIAAGVDSIEHGYFLSSESLQAMADQGIAWVPTLIPVAAQLRGKLREVHSPESLVVIEKTYRRQLEMVALAGELGVRLGAGSDAGAAGVLHGYGLLEELQLYQEAGLSREEILLTATRAAASILGRQDRLGVIRPGSPAFLLLVKGDPLKDIADLSGIAYVVKPVEGRPSEGRNLAAYQAG